MFSENIVIAFNTQIVTTRVKPPLFFELNGRLFNPPHSTDNDNATRISYNFVRGDRLGIYHAGALIQPFNYSPDSKEEAISSVLANAKQVQLNPFGGQNLSSYTFEPSAEEILNEFSRSNPNQFYVVNIGASKPAIHPYRFYPEYLFAKRAERLMGMNPLEGYSLKKNAFYFILSTARSGKDILSLTDSANNFPSKALIARNSIKRANYQIFKLFPLQDMAVGQVKLAVDDYLDVDDNQIPVAVQDGASYQFSYDPPKKKSMINPRFGWDTEDGLIDYGSYLFQEGSGDLREYMTQLPSFSRPADNMGFSVSVYTRHNWDSDGVGPEQPEIAEYVLSNPRWEKTSQSLTLNGQIYYKTTWTDNPISISQPQKMIWRYDGS